jgi:hypothetical protein
MAYVGCRCNPRNIWPSSPSNGSMSLPQAFRVAITEIWFLYACTAKQDDSLVQHLSHDSVAFMVSRCSSPLLLLPCSSRCFSAALAQETASLRVIYTGWYDQPATTNDSRFNIFHEPPTTRQFKLAGTVDTPHVETTRLTPFTCPCLNILLNNKIFRHLSSLRQSLTVYRVLLEQRRPRMRLGSLWT